MHRRILILGASEVGGYFGARLQATGGDMVFFVRPARAAQLTDIAYEAYEAGRIAVLP